MLHQLERIAWLLIALGFLLIAFRASENRRYQPHPHASMEFVIDTRTGRILRTEPVETPEYKAARAAEALKEEEAEKRHEQLPDEVKKAEERTKAILDEFGPKK